MRAFKIMTAFLLVVLTVFQFLLCFILDPEIHYEALSRREVLVCVTVYVVSWVITLLLMAVMLWLLMRKSIMERKRYLQYRRNIEGIMRKADRSIFTLSDTITHTKPIKPSALSLYAIVIMVILSCFIDNVIGILNGEKIFDLNRRLTSDTILGILFGPLRGGTILLVSLAICAGLANFFIWKLKIRRKNRIPMRIRVIKNKSEATK